MEASTIPATATAGLAPQRGSIVAGPLLRLRSDEQLVRLFRAGSEDAFRVIHDRYRARLFAYARQMLSGSRQDAEDALQDVFVRAYAALRANDRDVSLRAWLYRVAHNRCIDEIRRPAPPPPETFELIRPPASDPIATTEQREQLQRLVEDIGRLPDQQRSALLMREISGMSYDDLAAALGVTVPAIKSLLVRARVGLAQAAEARDTACFEIRESLADAHERGVRATGLARRHMQDCKACHAYRKELKATHERIAAFVPVLGPGALLAKLLGIGGGATAAGGGLAASAGAGAAAAGGGALGISTSQVLAVVAATVVSAGGAVEVHRTLTHRHAATTQVQSAPAPTATPIVTPAGTGAPTLPGTAAADPEAVGQTIGGDSIAPPVTGEIDAPSTEPEVRGGGAGLPPDLVESPPATEPVPPAADTPTPVEPVPSEGAVEPPPPGTEAGASGAGGTPAPPPAQGASTSPTSPPAP